MKPLKELLTLQLRDIRAKKEECDYYDKDDNLLVCGKCLEHKEFNLDLWKPEVYENGQKNNLVGIEPRYVIRPTLCKCERDRLAEEKAREDAMIFDRSKRENTARCFDLHGFSDVTFDKDDGQDAEASEVAHRFVDNFAAIRQAGQGMIFSGDTGGGKTYMAAMIANALLEKGYRVKFTSLSKLNQQMTENYGNNRASILRYIETCDLIVLDDLGTERDTSTANENAYQVIDTINRIKCPVIVTTNLSGRDMINEVEYKYKRNYSRIIERCKPVVFKTPDRRAYGNKEWLF